MNKQFKQTKQFHKCMGTCGVVAYLNYESALGLTPSQQDEYNKRRRTCNKCGQEAKPLTIDEMRRKGLDGQPGYEVPTEAILGMIKGPNKKNQ